jgi:hypothetical protein
MKVIHLLLSLSLQSAAFVAAKFTQDLSPPAQTVDDVPTGVISLSISTIPKPENDTSARALVKRIATPTLVTSVYDRPLLNEFTGSFYIVNCMTSSSFRPTNADNFQ